MGRTPTMAVERVADVYRKYQDEKRKRHVIDFDDLVRLCAQALEGDAEFAATQRWRFRHLFVDEFQDVSRAQLRLLRSWLGEGDDLCVVGDPDQAIYSFAGADPGYLTRFDEHFPGATTVRLDVNYRSTPEIVDAARGAAQTGARRGPSRRWLGSAAFDHQVRGRRRRGPRRCEGTARDLRPQPAVGIDGRALPRERAVGRVRGVAQTRGGSVPGSGRRRLPRPPRGEARAGDTRTTRGSHALA